MGKAFVSSFDISFGLPGFYVINKIQGHEQGPHEGLLHNFERVRIEFLKPVVSTLRLNVGTFFHACFIPSSFLFFFFCNASIIKITRKSHVINVINRV